MFLPYQYFSHILGLFLLIFTNVEAFSQIVVSDIDELKSTINAASPGDTIIIKDGTYSGNSMTLNVKGTTELPIVIKAESIGGVTFQEDSKFILRTCEYLVIQGIVFTNDGTAVKLEGSNNIRITRNTFRLIETSSTKWVYIGGVWDQPNSSFSHHNRIDHNLFENKNEAGHFITIDGSGEVTQSQFDLIDHNYFRSNKPRITNEKESIRVGWSEMSESSGFTVIEFNYFEECNGDPEIISVKSCDNIVRHNTFTKSEGTVSLRHGNRNRVEGNYFFGGGAACSVDAEGTHCTGGVRIYGEDHIIINNYFEGLKGERWDAPITLTEGDAESGNSSLSKHFRIERAVIAYNTLVNNDFGIEIGYDNGGNYSKPPRDVMMAYNIVQGSTNNLIKYYNQPDNMTWKSNVMYPTGSASLTNNGSTFLDDEVLISNPNLEYDDVLKMWKSTTTTQTYPTDNDIAGTIDFDIHGDTRGSTSSVGADDFSMESVRYAPLTPEDVGPSSYHPDYDGEVEVDYLLLSKSSLGYSAAEGTESLEIDTNLDWTAATDDPWLSFPESTGSGSATLVVLAAENTEFLARTGKIMINGGSFNREVQVIQEAAIPNLGGEKLSIIDITATAEQVDGSNTNKKENTIDSSFDTRWSAEGEQSIKFELKELYLVSYLKIAFHKGDIRTTTFKVEVSENGVDYAIVVDKRESSGTTIDFEYYDFNDVVGKFVKITGFGNSESDWNSITEVEIWGDTQPTGIRDLPGSLTNIKIYPNPVNDQINISGLPYDNYNFQLLNSSGQTVRSGVTNGDVIIIGELRSTGLHILRITNKDGLVIVSKLISR